MIAKNREKFAKKIRAMVRRGLPRKQALYAVGVELRAAGHPCSRRTLYRWLSEFKISLQ